jgi:hypothetical protein
MSASHRTGAGAGAGLHGTEDASGDVPSSKGFDCAPGRSASAVTGVCGYAHGVSRPPRLQSCHRISAHKCRAADKKLLPFRSMRRGSGALAVLAMLAGIDTVTAAPVLVQCETTKGPLRIQVRFHLPYGRRVAPRSRCRCTLPTRAEVQETLTDWLCGGACAGVPRVGPAGSRAVPRPRAHRYSAHPPTCARPTNLSASVIFFRGDASLRLVQGSSPKWRSRGWWPTS